MKDRLGHSHDVQLKNSILMPFLTEHHVTEWTEHMHSFMISAAMFFIVYVCYQQMRWQLMKYLSVVQAQIFLGFFTITKI